jgi:hypothetical protein
MMGWLRKETVWVGENSWVLNLGMPVRHDVKMLVDLKFWQKVYVRGNF